MADAMKAITKTIYYETGNDPANPSGLVDNPRDPGGITAWGLSINAHPQFNADHLRKMTRDVAVTYYLQWYWRPAFADIHSQILCDELFDFNFGDPAVAVKRLQIALGLPACLQDNVFGPVTLHRVNTADQDELIAAFVTQRLLFYTVDCAHQPEFHASWFRRTALGLIL